ncbi:hypothetical protein ILUMI_11529 [Ignelater luminosus]|uniref:Uncharacterized protein n=1 Tax=Ignelater luminosus TaxID=2038154 RepID=A0A8K0GD55_IGNLU|nr:hypothetical protein ILUMI_11529 [Ignelater luminosus]
MYEIIRRMNRIQYINNIIQDVSVKYVFPRQKACDGSSSQQTKITIADEEIEEIVLSTLENAKKDCVQLGISVIENSWNTLILLKYQNSTTEINEELEEDNHIHVLEESVVSDQLDSLVAYEENNSRTEEIKDKPDGGISENEVDEEFVFYRPITMIGTSPMNIAQNDKQCIVQKYRLIKHASK